MHYTDASLIISSGDFILIIADSLATRQLSDLQLCFINLDVHSLLYFLSFKCFIEIYFYRVVNHFIMNHFILSHFIVNHIYCDSIHHN